MGRRSALLVLIAGCGFSAHASSNSGGDDTASIDAAVPGDTAVDGAPPCVPGFLDLCQQAEPTTTLDITSAKLIDTDRDPLCRRLGQSGGGEVCLIYATDVRITSTGSITAFGSRPLAIAASSTLTIDGAIDVGSHGILRGPAANVMGCSFATSPQNDLGGGGGGAGGSFTLPGGDGGTGDENNNGGTNGTAAAGTHGSTTAISVLRGGCAGQTGGDEGVMNGGRGGRGGDSGGALYLFARQRLAVASSVRATGEGGEGGGGMSGGGGGGTGGLVMIESPSIAISGEISANGGGGGQGGGMDSMGKRVPGLPGSDGALGTTAAAGGSGALNNAPGFGNGGAGGALTAATAGTGAGYGGGGGGGAAGIIKLLGAQQQLSGSTISPAPQ